MKFVAILFIIAVVIIAACAVPFRDRPVPGRPGSGGFQFPFPGQGPFNPKPPKGPWGKPVGN